MLTGYWPLDIDNELASVFNPLHSLSLIDGAGGWISESDTDEELLYYELHPQIYKSDELRVFKKVWIPIEGVSDIEIPWPVDEGFEDYEYGDLGSMTDVWMPYGGSITGDVVPPPQESGMSPPISQKCLLLAGGDVISPGPYPYTAISSNVRTENVISMQMDFFLDPQWEEIGYPGSPFHEQLMGLNFNLTDFDVSYPYTVTYPVYVHPGFGIRYDWSDPGKVIPDSAFFLGSWHRLLVEVSIYQVGHPLASRVSIWLDGVQFVNMELVKGHRTDTYGVADIPRPQHFSMLVSDPIVDGNRQNWIAYVDNIRVSGR